MTEQTADTPIRLRWRDADKKVVVEPENEDRFMLTAEQAANACQQHQRIGDFKDQLRELLGRLAQWLRDHRDEIDKAFVTVRDGALLFLVVRSDVRYDAGFEDELTDLDMSIAQDEAFDALSVDVMTLPRCNKVAYEAFLSPEYTLAYEGTSGD